MSKIVFVHFPMSFTASTNTREHYESVFVKHSISALYFATTYMQCLGSISRSITSMSGVMHLTRMEIIEDSFGSGS